MWNKSTRADIQAMFADLVVFDHAGTESTPYITTTGPRDGATKPRKGGPQPAGYERRPHRAAYKKAWRMANADRLNAHRRALRVAERADDLCRGIVPTCEECAKSAAT